LISAVAGSGIAVIDSATATASALASLLEVNGLAARRSEAPRHVQFTTGDVASFRRTTERLFGSLFAAVEAVELVGAA